MNSMLAYFEVSDRRISERAERWRAPRWVRRWMIVASHLGDGWLWIACTAFLASREPRGLESAATAAIAVNAALVALKRVTRRPRPPGCAIARLDRFSFPSGHATNAFAACGLFALAEPESAAIALVIAANVAAARVVMGRHYLTDVIGGGALGTLAAAAAYSMFLGG